MEVRLQLTGERALFARPEFASDLISYDLITPHAARGVLDAIYRSAGLTWVIDAIRILSPIRHECVEEDGHRVLMLRDVHYLIDAHFELDDGAPDGAAGRHAALFRQAVRSMAAPDLGRAGCEAVATLVDADDPVDAGDCPHVTTDHGWLYHGVDPDDERRLRFFRACAVGGLVRVPAPDSPMLFA